MWDSGREFVPIEFTEERRKVVKALSDALTKYDRKKGLTFFTVYIPPDPVYNLYESLGDEPYQIDLNTAEIDLRPQYILKPYLEYGYTEADMDRVYRVVSGEDQFYWCPAQDMVFEIKSPSVLP